VMPSSPSVPIKSSRSTPRPERTLAHRCEPGDALRPALDRQIACGENGRPVRRFQARQARRWATPAANTGGGVLSRVATGPIALVTARRVASLDGRTGRKAISIRTTARRHLGSSGRRRPRASAPCQWTA
jgi:hypothetical protein